MADIFHTLGLIFGGLVPEQIPLFIFGISMFGITGGVRAYLNRRRSADEELFGRLVEEVVVETE